MEMLYVPFIMLILDAGVAVASRKRELSDDAGKRKSSRRSWTVSEVG